MAWHSNLTGDGGKMLNGEETRNPEQLPLRRWKPNHEPHYGVRK